ncbi:Cytadhesion [Operophtera brumata]|uniref:Cytadhesion n=1 Tax=Operophtera brumata TaxID=104452 RepID=A0A0L7L400_OPEBR|nr:Cytadhesion [Operophtera brumata]
MEIKAVPKETLSIIPKYDGEENLLNLFISKCEYVVNGSKAPGNAAQDLYLFHVVSSKLTGRAATLLSDHPNIKSYEQLKDLLTQHFGDPRSEECIAIELETLKLKQGETYIQFCHRIQNVRSSLFAKVNRLTDEGIKAAKMIVYNNTALNVFLYNLPEDMIRIVRLKGCSNLENALSIVTEEVNFKFQYDAKNKILKQTPSQPPISQNSQNALRPLPAAQDNTITINDRSGVNVDIVVEASPPLTLHADVAVGEPNAAICHVGAGLGAL